MSNSAEEKGRFPETQSIEYAMTLIAVIWGPAIMVFGYRIGMPFLSPLVYVLVCFTIVPAIMAFSGRLKFLNWQIAVLSLALSILGDNLRLHAIRDVELFQVPAFFWLIGSIASSWLPIYILGERHLNRRR